MGRYFFGYNVLSKEEKLRMFRGKIEKRISEHLQADLDLAPTTQNG